MSGHEEDTDIRESTPNSSGPERAAGGMGVSSERVGHTGPGQVATDGLKPTMPDDLSAQDAPPEQSTGGPETNPSGLPAKAGYPSKDPRSDDKPFEP